MRIGKKDPNLVSGKDYWTEVLSTEVTLEPNKLILNSEPGASYNQAAVNTTSTNASMPTSTDFDFIANNSESWTIDWWAKLDTLGSNDTMWNRSNGGTTNLQLQIHSANTGVQYQCSVVGSNILICSTTGGGFTSDLNWHHYALVIVGNGSTKDVGIYIDGQQRGHTQDNSTATTTDPFYIGGTGTGRFAGKLDEFRVYKGNPFNASPNSGKTDTISVPAGPYTSDANTKLLLHFDGNLVDSSSSAHTVTNNGMTFEQSGVNATVAEQDTSGWDNPITFLGDAKVELFKFNEAGVFNGTSAYLTAPDSADWDVFANTTSSWTIDAWIKLDSLGDGTVVQQFEDNSNRWQFDFTTTSIGYLLQESGVSEQTAYANHGMTAGSWYHVALVKIANEVGIYVDGIQLVYVQDNDIASFSGLLYVGRNAHSSVGNYFDGRMDEVRIYNGNPFSAAPNIGKTDTITVPTAAHTSDSNTKLLLHLDNNVTDSGNTVHTVTNNNVTFDKAKFGRGMLTFDGTGDYLTVPDNADGRWDVIGSVDENWTIDMWVRHTDHTGSEAYVCHYEDASNLWVFKHVDGSGIYFSAVTGGSNVILTTAAGEITDSNWHHIALIKSGSKYAVYKDGTQISYLSDTSVDTYNGSLLIGAQGAGTYFDGKIDALRITKENVFDANPVVGLTDTIAVPTSAPEGSGDVTVLPNEIFVDGLNGDTAEAYRITTHFVNQSGTTTNYTLNVNGDFASNYGYQRMSGAVTTVSASRLGSQTGMYITANSLTADGTYAASDGIINSKGGKQKVFSNTWLAQGTGTTVGMVNERSETWSGTNPIESLTITTSATDGIGEGSTIKIFKRQ